MQKPVIGIIGGSGIYELDNLKIISEEKVSTAFGLPSDNVIIGEISGNVVAFLSRHGKGHWISPSEINNRANIMALKQLGVRRIISISAVGSLKEEIRPGDFVIPDQLFDRTKGRVATFFGNGCVAHVSMADPYCENLSSKICQKALKLGIPTHSGGTYVCIEGPQFSTRAESHFYRSLDASVIGMTNLPEAKLAREAELCYATIALATDYDVWKEETVNVEMVLSTLKKNGENVKKLLSEVLCDPEIYSCEDHSCFHSLECAIMTRHDLIPVSTMRTLEPLIGRYIRK